jgi:hypothetical protein
MGAAVRRVQDAVGGIVTFFNSAPGNVDPFYRVGTNFDHVEELGEKLANEVQRVLSEKMIEAVPTPIYVIPTEVGLPLKTPGEDTNPVSVISTSIIRIGDLQFITFPGEMFAETGLVLKARSSARFPFIISYFCGKSAGYLPVRSDALLEPPYTTDPILRGFTLALQKGRLFPLIKLGGLLEEKLSALISNIWAQLVAGQAIDIEATLVQEITPIVRHFEQWAGKFK